jgi:hypothetical protein
MKKEVLHNLTNKLLAIILLITIIANVVQFFNYKSHERFDWTGSVISSKGNIVQVATCDFKGNEYHINKDKILDNSWYEINGCENYMKNIFFPNNLSIKWFSYIEQKFYGGDFVLPIEMIRTKAVKMGMILSIKNDYDSDKVLHFIAEVQPNGKLVVWMQKFNGNNQVKFKVGTFQAKEIKATWHIFDRFSETDSISEINISKKVALVMERHSYRLKIKLPNEFKVDGFQLDFFNQNNWYLDRDKLQSTVFYNIPKGFWLKWGNGKKQFDAQFTFDKDEVLDLFRKESANKDNSVSLVLELIATDKNNTVKAMLNNIATNFKIELSNDYESRYEREFDVNNSYN